MNAILLFDEEGAYLGEMKFSSSPFVGDVLLFQSVLFEVRRRRWNLTGDLELIISEYGAE